MMPLMKDGVHSIMIIRLHNLLARALEMKDACAVANLLSASDDDASSKSSDEDDIRARWSKAGFLLAFDAWMIITKQGQPVGYADVQYQAAGPAQELVLTFYVLPSFSTGRVILCARICNEDCWAIEMLSREGYTRMHSFWRVRIELQQSLTQHLHSTVQKKPLQLDLVVDTGKTDDDGMSIQLDGDTLVQTDVMSTMRQYSVYGKILRDGASCELMQDLPMQYVSV
jgi:hypothetical protein